MRKTVLHLLRKTVLHLLQAATLPALRMQLQQPCRKDSKRLKQEEASGESSGNSLLLPSPGVTDTLISPINLEMD